MDQYITSVEVNMVEGKFNKIVHFKSGLNIISGENGTLKTKLVQAIAVSMANRGSSHPMHQEIGDVKLKFSNTDTELKAIFISPKRNSEKRNINAVLESLKNQVPQSHMDMSVFNQFEDNTYKTYPSIGELFYRSFNEKNKLGGDQKINMNEVSEEFNQVIIKIFDGYNLIATWSSELGRPEIKLDKGNRGIVPIESISLGEQEILSLILNLYDNRNSCDTIFIDEPETHLNWHLEEKLFNYFVDYSKSFGKQIIAITHSRIIFWESFLQQTQFLYWNESGEIDISNRPNDKIKTILAGEITEIIKLGDFDRLTFFVEDSTHELIISLLSKEIGTEVTCVKCGNCSNVKSLFKSSKKIGEWGKTIFLVDGDNQGNEFPDERNFIHLDKYCLENYLLDREILEIVLNKNSLEVTDFILETILENKKEILGKNQFLEFLLDKVVSTELDDRLLSKLDASKIIPNIIKKSGIKDKEEFVKRYIHEANKYGNLDKVFPIFLVSIIRAYKI